MTDWIENLPRDRLLAEMSLWSADLIRIRDEIARMDPYTDLYHLDVADGRFSPALLFFPDFVAQIRRSTARPLHVHLMVDDAILMDQIDQFAEAGADLISLHAENANAAEGLKRIAGLGIAAGLVLQLHTPVEAAKRMLAQVDMLTLLGTRIGVKGQGLDAMAEARLADAQKLIAEAALPRRILLAADGGIREHTVPGLRRAGAETVVMGSLAFNAPDLAGRMAWIHAQGTAE
jgi:ribulose-phosphate 3-epimerase